jgi:type I restriction enzyme S subunit
MMQEVLLSSICDLKNGFAFKSKDYVDSSNTLSCRMSSIRPGGNFDLEHNQRFLPDTYAEVYSDYLLNDGDIVIAMTDLAGDPKILGVPTIVNTGGKKLLQNQRVGKLVITNSSKVFIPYLQYALNRPSNKSYYKKFAGGGLQINVSKKDILNNSVPLPPIDQQKKIAAILDAADTYRQKTKALITKYDELTQSLFLDMFGDPVNNPKGWGILTVRDIIEEAKYGTSSKAVENGSYCYLRMNNITYKGYMNYSKLKYINMAEEQVYKYETKKGDILFNRTNSKELVGKTGIITSDEKMILAGYLIRVRMQERYNPYFLWAHLNSKWAKQTLENMCKNIVGMANINAQELQNIIVLNPPFDLQNQFAERIKAIEIQKTQAQASLAQADDLFNSLLQKAFKGELNS